MTKKELIMKTNVNQYSKPSLGILLVIVCSLALQADTSAGWRLGGKNPEVYEAGTDAQVLYDSQPSVYLRGKEPAPKVAGLLHDLPADKYAGKRVRLNAFVRSEGVEDGALLLLHVDSKTSGLTESTAGPVRGTSDWRSYEIVVDIPQNAASIYIGVSLVGQGTVWLNNVKVEVVGADVPTTRPSLST
jgi:hypothetical protein